MKKHRLKNGCLWLALVILALLFLLPTILTVVNSFLSAAEIERSYGAVLGGDTYMKEQVILRLVPDIATGEQYHTFLLQSPEYLQKFWNSVLYTVPITILQVAVSALAAYGFCRRPSRLRRLIFFGYLVLTLMPYQVTLAPNYLVSKQLGTYDTIWAILLPGIFSPFAVFLLTKYMQRIPREYIEAAQLDGANEWQIFRRIFLPQCKSALFAVGMLVFFDYWNMVEQPMVLLEQEELQPLSIYLSRINEGELGLAFAAAVIYMIPCLLLFLGGEKHLEEGIVTGGIK
ncbi:MAG: carbohydrate ABC transporter permease [Oscillospiraceae bacterium]|nr:carbohydrate ABC transporter permease [Oscillospiraceae bacterium]